MLEKIIPINESGSDASWVNDTVEVFRVCPEYTMESSSGAVVVIGRNFHESDVLGCRFTTCSGTSYGPFKCPSVASKRTAGKQKTIVVEATHLSSTRIQCNFPEYVFPSNISRAILEGVCAYDDEGTIAYIQSCDAEAISNGSCEDDAGEGQHFVYDVLVRSLYFWRCLTPGF